MSLSPGFVEHVKDLLGGIGEISVRRMFGGAGVYCDGYIFAFLDEDVLYLKTDAAGRAAFEDEGMGPFTFESKDGPDSARRAGPSGAVPAPAPSTPVSYTHLTLPTNREV